MDSLSTPDKSTIGRATLRDKMYRDLIVPMFNPNWSPEFHEKTLEWIVQYREEIENYERNLAKVMRPFNP